MGILVGLSGLSVRRPSRPSLYIDKRDRVDSAQNLMIREYNNKLYVCQIKQF